SVTTEVVRREANRCCRTATRDCGTTRTESPWILPRDKGVISSSPVALRVCVNRPQRFPNLVHRKSNERYRFFSAIHSHSVLPGLRLFYQPRPLRIRILDPGSSGFLRTYRSAHARRRSPAPGSRILPLACLVKPVLAPVQPSKGSLCGQDPGGR